MSKTDQLRDNVKALRDEYTALIATNEEIVNSVKSTEGEKVEIEVTQEQKDAFQANLARMKELRTIIEGAEETIDGKAFMNGVPSPAVAMAAAAGILHESAMHGKTVGQLFIESDEFKTLEGGRNGYTMPKPFTLKVRDLAGHALGAKDVGGSTGDVFTDLPTGTPGAFGRVDRVGMIGRQHRTFRIRDLFGAVPTTATVIEYFRVTGFTNAASMVPERDSGDIFGLKPRSSLTFVGEQANVRTIAHWIGAHRNVLADEPGLRNVIDTELLYGLQLIEDAQILNGQGTSQDLLGIFNVQGVQEQDANSPANTNADAVRKAITKVALAEYEATGIVMHPSNWESVELERETPASGPGQYVNAIVSNITSGAEPRIWRLPIVVTQAITEDTALVGAFGIGATLYDREDATIRVSENLDDWFVRNAVAILAEERLALTVQRPEAFCTVVNLD